MTRSLQDSNSTPAMELVEMLPLASDSTKETQLNTSSANKFKIIAWSAGVFVAILAFIAISVIIVQLYSSNEKSNEDFCQSDNSEYGQCVSISKCREIMLTTEDSKHECGSASDVDKVCCPHDSILASEIQIKPSFDNFTEFVIVPISDSDEPIPIERVGLRISDGEKRKFHNHERCGTSKPVRIINGQKVNPGEFPFFVALKYKIKYEDSESQFKFFCGGSLITDRYVLTAAHCIVASLSAARVGEPDLSEDKDCKNCPPAVDHDIEKILIHSQYINTTSGSDIALLRLKKPVNITTPYVKPICLPTENENYLNESEPMQVMGFGITEDRVFPDVLLKVFIPFVPIEQCNGIYNQFLEGNNLREGQMCAGFTAKKKNATDKKMEKVRDTCQRDSGGPLIAFSENSNGLPRMFQYGIVSFGIKCGKFPGVYTSVVDFINWIADNIEQELFKNSI